MFKLFGKKSILKSGVFEGMIDIHSHVLPCVDDGAQTLKHSIDIVDVYKEIGVSKVFCTPHVKASMPTNTTQSLINSFTEYNKQSLGVEFKLAAEYMLDENFVDVVSSGKLLTFDGEHILVEINRRNKLLDVYEMLFGIIVGGYTPILAHPERYLSISKGDLLSIKERGVLFQLNVPSLSNYYGDTVAKRAKELLDDDLYDFAATDFHSDEQLKYLSEVSLNGKDTKKLGGVIENNNSLWNL